MPQGMTGANVEELERLATEFDRAAERVVTEVRLVRASLDRARWQGSYADRFRNEWNVQHARRLQQIAQELRDAARRLRANAQEQRHASRATVQLARTVPFTPTPGPLSPFGSAFGKFASGAAVVGLLDTGSGAKDLLKGTAKAGKGGPLGLVTVPFDTVSLVEGIASGDGQKAFSGGAGVTLTALGVACPPAGVIGGAGSFAINTFLQPDHTVNSYIERTYGGEMTPSQSADFSHRYDGIKGFGHFIGDGFYGSTKTMWKKVFG